MSTKAISTIMRIGIVLVVTTALLCVASGCRTERDWKMVASTIEIGMSTGIDGDGSISKGARSYDMDEGTRLFASFHPFAPWEQPREVIIVQPPVLPAPVSTPEKPKEKEKPQ